MEENIVEPMKTFPHVKDLVTDVSWNYEVKKKIQKFTPRKPDAPDGTWRVQQADVDRPQEFRKCIECFLCQDVCHVLRDHGVHDQFIGPRFLITAAQLEMNPLDTGNRLKALEGRVQHRLPQHHQVLYEGVPGRDQDYRLTPSSR
jgi:succinate dehydrogenase / fumarate reductase iron-sulfur subunit